MRQACDGIKVLDFSMGISGALVSMFLADNGADVIKVEPPAGDPDRAAPAFLQWARGKRSVVLDLKTSQGQEAARDLAEGADVVLENYRPGVADRLGIGFEVLSKATPALVYCSISGFGQRGPYRNIKAYDAVVAAKTGRMLGRQPWTRQGPVFEAISRMSHGAAHLATQGILAALLAREQTGKGQWVQTSLVQAATVHSLGQWLTPVGREEERVKEFEAPRPSASEHERSPAGYLIVECKDGRWIQMASTSVKIFRNFVTLLGLADVYDDPAFSDLPYSFPSPEARAAFIGKIRARMSEKPAQEWIDLFLEDGNVGGEIYETTREFMSHPQAVYNGLTVEVDDPRVGKMRQIGHLVSFSETPSKIQGPAPDLGQQTQEVLASLRTGDSPWRSAATALTRSADRARKRPLDGVTILELASYYAAPFGTTLLAELGARLIKIEPPSGDLMRRIPEVFPKTVQGKESIAIDLKQARGRHILYQLVERADALMHNFRPRTWQAIGLDPAEVRKANPRLMYLYAGSYGSKGPFSRQPAFHPTISGISGSGIRMAGEGNPPIDSGQGDPDAALGVATGLLLGLHAQLRNDTGQYTETRMINTGAFDVSDEYYDYEGRAPERSVDSGQHGFHALYRLYETADGWLFVGCPRAEEWRTLCVALGREDLAKDQRFATPEARATHDAVLTEALATELKARSADAWERLLLQHDLGCVRADGLSWPSFWLVDPSIKQNGLDAVTSHEALGGDYHRHGPTVHFSDMETVHGPPATLGQHTEPILLELGYSIDEIDAMEDARLIVRNGPWIPGRS